MTSLSGLDLVVELWRSSSSSSSCSEAEAEAQEQEPIITAIGHGNCKNKQQTSAAAARWNEKKTWILEAEALARVFGREI